MGIGVKVPEVRNRVPTAVDQEAQSRTLRNHRDRIYGAEVLEANVDPSVVAAWLGVEHFDPCRTSTNQDCKRGIEGEYDNLGDFKDALTAIMYEEIEKVDTSDKGTLSEAEYKGLPDWFQLRVPFSSLTTGQTGSGSTRAAIPDADFQAVKTRMINAGGDASRNARMSELASDPRVTRHEIYLTTKQAEQLLRTFSADSAKIDAADFIAQYMTASTWPEVVALADTLSWTNNRPPFLAKFESYKNQILEQP